MAAFLFKVFTLTIRTISKPMAARVQSYVMQHPKLRKPVIDLAQVRSGTELISFEAEIQSQGLFTKSSLFMLSALQALHRLEVRVNRGAEGKSEKVFVGSLSEERAMDLAGKVVSEAFVWGVGLFRMPHICNSHASSSSFLGCHGG